VRQLPHFNDPNLVVGAEGFSDAGVYRLGDDLLIVQSLDFFPPLVDDPFTFGQIAAANSLSDVYAMGARPVMVLNIVGFPDDKLHLDILCEILRGGSERVQLAGAVVAGGHSVRDAEIKYGMCATGIVKPDQLLTNSNAQPGDALVLTKALGTGFVTTAFKAGKCGEETLAAAVAGMIALNKSASEAAVECQVSAATDITGFGLAGHANEMAQASGVTVQLQMDRLPLLPGAAELARRGNRTRASSTNRSYSESTMRIENSADPALQEFAFDAQTSGGLLISVAADKADELVRRSRAGGATDSCIVGQVLPEQDVSLILG
jgi:selenide,water dikinase